MTTRPKPHLVVHAGDRAELGRQMLRAYDEHRYEDGRALVARIAHRATLRVVDVAPATADETPADGGDPDIT